MQASCQCGKLTASVADGAEAMTVMCHCRDCQKRTGSHYGSIAYFPTETVAVQGEAREFSRGTDSGHTFTTGFCPTCGSTVYARASRMPAIIGVTVGTITDPALAAPVRSVYEQSKHAWVTPPAEATRHPKGRETSW
jgi:hypothetical protein